MSVQVSMAVKINTIDLRKWTPTSDIMSHSGTPLPVDLVFFSEPPKCIGLVVSANSNLSEADVIPNKAMHYALFLILSTLVTLIVSIMGGDIWWVVGTVLLMCLFGAAIHLYVMTNTYYVKTNTFVGTDGLARFTIANLKEGSVSEIVEFSAISDIKTMVMKRYVNSGYVRTEYRYAFSRFDKQGDFVIAGSHNCEEGSPQSTDAYWFCYQAERFWNNFKAPMLMAQINERGFIEFPANRSDFIRVSSQSLEFSFKGCVERIERHEIKELSICAGTIHIRRKNTKLFSKQGKFHFDAAEVGNVKLLIMCLCHFDYELEQY